jgi:hypothetical protein
MAAFDPAFVDPDLLRRLLEAYENGVVSTFGFISKK